MYPKLFVMLSLPCLIDGWKLPFTHGIKTEWNKTNMWSLLKLSSSVRSCSQTGNPRLPSVTTYWLEPLCGICCIFVLPLTIVKNLSVILEVNYLPKQRHETTQEACTLEFVIKHGSLDRDKIQNSIAWMQSVTFESNDISSSLNQQNKSLSLLSICLPVCPSVYHHQLWRWWKNNFAKNAHFYNFCSAPVTCLSFYNRLAATVLCLTHFYFLSSYLFLSCFSPQNSRSLKSANCKLSSVIWLELCGGLCCYQTLTRP